MLSIKKFTKIIAGFIFLLIFSAGIALMPVYAAGEELYLGGFPAGFLLNTQTVEVIGTCDIMTKEGLVSPARESGIEAGDVVEYVNDKTIKSADELTEAIKEDYSIYKIGINRNGEKKEITITPAKENASGKKRLGLLVKDSLNGIGTITYVDKSNNKFGSLGHPVTDANGKLIEINGGSIYGCMIYDVKKGVRGNPGELKGVFENTNMIGNVVTNCQCGIFGNVSEGFNTSHLRKIKKGNVDDVTIGKVKIYTTLNGDKCKEYDASIVKVDANNKDKRNYVLKIEDEELISKSGGIVQGMSGSPIVQNGKLIGAVTHVFVNDPTRGYGISIENMMSSY